MHLLTVDDDNICTLRAQDSTHGCLTEKEVVAEYVDLFDGISLLEGDVQL